MVRLSWGILVVGTLVFAVAGLVRAPDSDSVLLDVVVYESVFLAGAALCWCSASPSREDRLAWRFAALYLLLYVGGDLWYGLVLSRLDEVPYPSPADAFYLLSYLPLGASVVVMARSRVRRLRASMWLDGLVAGLGATGLAVALAWPTLAAADGDNAAVVLVNLAYPLLDVALLAGVLAAIAIVGLRRDGPLLALAAGLGLSTVADLVYLVRAADDEYVEGGLLDLTWLLAVVALAVGARLSQEPRAGSSPHRDETRISWRVLALPALAHTTSVALLVAGWGDRLPVAAGLCAGACVVGAMARTVVTFHEIRDLPLVREQARTDDLTGLANRRVLLERGAALLSPSGDHRAPGHGTAALLLLDLDAFKEVNDSLGHHAGDELLQQVARRLSVVAGADRTLARLGGDEFALLVPGCSADHGLELAQVATEALAGPFLVDGVSLHVGASIGVASAPDPAGTITELLRCADVAMYEAKRSALPFLVFSGVQGSATSERLRTTEELREAFVRGELVVHLQPQVALVGGGVVGVEALVRWHHPSRGLLAPGSFLDHVERAGLQRRLAERVLDLSLAAAARWWGAGRAVPVSVNLSAADVIDVDLPSAVLAAVERHGLPATALTVELTEDALMQDAERGSAVLQVLRDAGVGVSIDDYGTGYASLAYLRSLPADELKLDRAFTADVLSDPRAMSIVRHTAALAHDLGMHLVAEGIEDQEVLERLEALGCDRGQGYHVARPMPVEDLLRWLGALAPGPRVRAPGPASSGSRDRPWTAPGPPTGG